MIILSVSEISKFYGSDQILDKVSFHVNKGEKIGIIGPNGAGKTTLLSILAGEIPYDHGSFHISAKESLDYLKQKNNLFSENTIYQETLSIFSQTIDMERELKDLSVLISQGREDLLDRYDFLSQKFQRIGGFSYESEIKGILSSMSFTEEAYTQQVSQLSGGEQTRLALAISLLKKPSILLLDEPTNHLDAQTLAWLEQHLANYKGTLLIVSHDRYFLDKTVNRIFELEHGKLNIFPGNYSQYVKNKKEQLKQEKRRYKTQVREIKRHEDMVRRLSQHGTEKLARRAKSVQRRLDGMEKAKKPTGSRQRMSLNFKERYESGNDVLFVRDLAMGFGSNEEDLLFENLDLHIRKGEKVCLVGANGAGKTTLLNILMKKRQAKKGKFQFGHNVLCAYYDQQQALLRKDHTVLDEVHDDYRLYTETELRRFLGRFNFHGDDVFKKVDDLSGGERAKLSLLKLMLSGANFLIMDEPTNHLDIASKEVFEDAILSFPGTVLIVSHDRYLLSKIPDKIVELTKDAFLEYPGNYEYYLDKKSQLQTEQPVKEKSIPATKITRAEIRRKAKEEEARIRRLTRGIVKKEKLIETLEEEILEMEKEMCKEEVFTDLKLANEYSEKLEAAKENLEKTYARWLELKESF